MSRPWKLHESHFEEEKRLVTRWLLVQPDTEGFQRGLALETTYQRDERGGEFVGVMKPVAVRTIDGVLAEEKELDESDLLVAIPSARFTPEGLRHVHQKAQNCFDKLCKQRDPLILRAADAIIPAS